MFQDLGTQELFVGAIAVTYPTIRVPNNQTLKAIFSFTELELNKLYSFVNVRLFIVARNGESFFDSQVYRIDPEFSPVLILFPDDNDYGRRLDVAFVAERISYFAPVGDTSKMSMAIKWDAV